MTDQLEKAKEFVNSITRDLNLVPRHNGFDLESKLSGKRFGFVRYNVDGENKERYCVYAYGTFDDPEKRFCNKEQSNPRGWKYLFPYGNPEAKGYAVRVLESSGDHS